MNDWFSIISVQLQSIVCMNGEAGINFEYIGINGHTILRCVSENSVLVFILQGYQICN